MLDIVICGRIYLVLSISDIVFTEDKARGMWYIFKVEPGIYHYHYTFVIYEYVGYSFIISNIKKLFDSIISVILWMVLLFVVLFSPVSGLGNMTKLWGDVIPALIRDC